MATPVSNSVSLTGNQDIARLIQGSSWSLPSNKVITYSLHNIAEGSVWTQTEIDAVDSAFATWEAVANIDFVRLGDPNSFNLESTPADIAISFTGSILSSLIQPRNDYPKPEGDIFIDDFSPFWFPNLNEGGEGFHTIVHEIGHALGLNHPGANGNGFSWDQLHSVMSYNGISTVLNIAEISSIGHAATPMPYDILAIQRTYGANRSYHTGNDNYILQDDGILKTIWDVGGIDTLDASSVNNNVFLDLRAVNSQPPVYIL